MDIQLQGRNPQNSPRNLRISIAVALSSFSCRKKLVIWAIRLAFCVYTPSWAECHSWTLFSVKLGNIWDALGYCYSLGTQAPISMAKNVVKHFELTKVREAQLLSNKDRRNNNIWFRLNHSFSDSQLWRHGPGSIHQTKNAQISDSFL